MELSPPDPRIGQILQGRYRILARVAAGAMGVVYRGERVELARPVAVKFLHPWIAAQQAFRTRFETEARAMSRLGHPNCVSVIDFGFEGSPYVVMDFIAGFTLRQLMEGGRLRPSRAVGIARQLLAGVAHAHAQGIIHRDLKPENFILGDTTGLADHVRILDFGLAKLRDGPAMTSGLAIGTPSYMSPEQTGAPGEIDGRTDVYAIGVVLFEMLAGRKPFVSDKVADILLMHRDAPPPSLRDTVPDAGISQELQTVVNRALAKTPGTRFQTAVAFAQALDQVPEAAAARAVGNFPSASTAVAPLPVRPPPVAPADVDGDKTIADPSPSHLALADSRAESVGLPVPTTAGAGDAAGARSLVFGLTGARWLGLGAVAVVALALVAIGLWRRPSASTPAGTAGAPVRSAATAKGAAAPSGSKVGEGEGEGEGQLGQVGQVDKTSKANATGTPAAVAPSAGSPTRAAAPTSPSTAARLATANSLIAAGEWEQAMVVLEKARRESPQSAEAAYEHANLALEHKRWAEGAQAARVAGERDPKYRGDERLVKNLIRSLASDKGYERTEDVLHGFGAGAVPFLKVAASKDGSPLVRQRAAELLRGREGGRVSARPSATRKSSSRSIFSR